MRRIGVAIAVVMTARATAATPCERASGAPSTRYPTRYPERTAAELAARRAALVATGDWRTILLDEYGFVITATGALGPRSATTAIECHPDAFGTGTATLPTDQAVLVQQADGDTLARITVEHDRAGVTTVIGHWWPAPRVPAATRTGAMVRARVIDQVYDATWQLGPPPCAHGVPCPAPPPVHQELRVDADAIDVHAAIVGMRLDEHAPLELRRVIRIDAHGRGGACTPTACVPRGRAPRLPLVIDAVTGDDLSSWQSCGAGDEVCRLGIR